MRFPHLAHRFLPKHLLGFGVDCSEAIKNSGLLTVQLSTRYDYSKGPGALEKAVSDICSLDAQTLWGVNGRGAVSRCGCLEGLSRSIRNIPLAEGLPRLMKCFGCLMPLIFLFFPIANLYSSYFHAKLPYKSRRLRGLKCHPQRGRADHHQRRVA